MLPLVLSLVVDSAEAGSYALEPQNRFHVGLSMVDAPAPVGLSMGLDSRLTRILAMDVGIFVSPFPMPEAVEEEEDAYQQYFRLRHGIYLAPGLRIPHPQPKTWAWEVFVRPGAGVVWAANLDPFVYGNAGTIRPGPAGSLGVDAFVRFGKAGLRAYGRGWVFGGYRVAPDENFVLVRPNYGLEALYQW